MLAAAGFFLSRTAKLTYSQIFQDDNTPFCRPGMGRKTMYRTIGKSFTRQDTLAHHINTEKSESEVDATNLNILSVDENTKERTWKQETSPPPTQKELRRKTEHRAAVTAPVRARTPYIYILKKKSPTTTTTSEPHDISVLLFNVKTQKSQIFASMLIYAYASFPNLHMCVSPERAPS